LVRLENIIDPIAAWPARAHGELSHHYEGWNAIVLPKAVVREANEAFVYSAEANLPARKHEFDPIQIKTLNKSNYSPESEFKSNSEFRVAYNAHRSTLLA
jgi:hypothetical protein